MGNYRSRIWILQSEIQCVDQCWKTDCYFRGFHQLSLAESYEINCSRELLFSNNFLVQHVTIEFDFEAGFDHIAWFAGCSESVFVAHGLNKLFSLVNVFLYLP